MDDRVWSVNGQYVLPAGEFESVDPERFAPLHDDYKSRLQLGRRGLPYAASGRTPPIWAFWITATQALSVVLHGFRNGGKWRSCRSFDSRNCVEGFFLRMARSMLRHICVASKAELKECILAYLDDINADPVVHTWTHKIRDTA